MSDSCMRDARTGKLSPRGCVDAALDAGYFALLSVLTGEERRAYEHPSPQVVEIACRRLNLDSMPGVLLQGLRYSGDEAPSLVEVLAWAEGVRARARGLGIK